MVLLQGLIAIGATKISIGKISSNCEFEFVVGLWIAKHATHRKVNFCVDCFCEQANFGHNFTCGELLLHHNGIHLVVTQFCISFFFEFLALFSFILDKLLLFFFS